MNEKKISFISCVTNERQYKESLLYIDHLTVPSGFEVETRAIRDAKSMAQGYNLAMRDSDAKYKIYLHQDVYIINKNFILDMIQVFKSNHTIGLMGVAGARKLPSSGVWWEATSTEGQVYESHTGVMSLLSFSNISTNYVATQALDGLILMTQYDIPWREDIFTGFHFYDISQSLEYIRAGFNVVVPNQQTPWVIHDCGLKVGDDYSQDYENFRNKFIGEYGKEINKKFTFYFPKIENVHFTKDICIIPYVLKKYYGYNSSLLINMPYEYFENNEKYLDNLPIIFAESEEEVDKELATIDVLMLVGMHDFNISMINRYKNIKPDGKIYLKLDINEYWINGLEKRMNVDLIDTINKCDLISAESRRQATFLKYLWQRDIIYIPNGYYQFFDENFVNYENKQNIILSVGRLGTFQKNTELLVEAFMLIKDNIRDWTLVLAGPVEEHFLNYIQHFYDQDKTLEKRIILTKELDKESLNKLYRSAKIACLTSIFEACANVLSESIGVGCYLIATDVAGAIDIVDYGKYGAIVPVGDVTKLGKTILEVCKNEELLKTNCTKSQEFARNEMNWITICSELRNLL